MPVSADSSSPRHFPEALGDRLDLAVIDRNDSFVFGFSKLDVMFGRGAPDAVRHEPLRFSWSLETLARQAPLLAAAEALEKRADAIQKWPFSDALLARVVVIASSVAAAVIARLAQRFLGL